VIRSLFLILLVASAAGAQSDSASTRLDPVIVTVTRGSGRSMLASPFALSVIRPDSMRPGQRHNAVDESLAFIPGLASSSRNNPSQDPRLSIRGFGARSAFGVRGIRVLRDGMPLTLPDGQTPLDYLSLESVGRIEVMRGSASALYGNASGGVIDILTADPSPRPLSMDARQWLGNAGFRRSVVAASGTSGRLGYVVDAAHLQGDGARDHSRQRATSGFGRVTYSARNRLSLSVMALHNPLAQNPGALTLDEMNNDPGAADPNSVRRNALKEVRQIQIGTSFTRPLPRGELSLSAFGGTRSLDNPLPFAVIEIGRHSWGASGSVRHSSVIAGTTHRFSLGTDFQSLNDLRRNYAACADTVPRASPTTSCPDIASDHGIVTLDQRELVSSVGVYLSDELELGERISATAGLRADNVRFEVEDRLVSQSNPDDSGKRSLRSFSPIAGVIARITPLNSIYLNVSSAFETPTATELGNQPDGSAGINRELDPQRSNTIEAGAKGFAGRLRYDAAIFATRVTDELVPFEIPDSDGRRYFRNAGRTSRRGVEMGGDIVAGPLILMAAYNYSRFRFVDFTVGTTDFSGKQIPGIPAHRFQGAVTLSQPQWFGGIEAEVAGSGFADDANSVSTPGYSVFHARAGYSPFRGSRRAAVTLAVQNVLDRVYASSVAVNAARSRYFEPALPRTFSIGVSIGVSGGGSPAGDEER
jgi:iron complex outermembrane receptor protein